MKNNLARTIAVLLVVAAAFGQRSLTGRWQTDNVRAALAAQAVGGRGPSSQAIVLDLKVAGNKVSGTITEIGSAAVTIESGTLDGNIVTLVIQSRDLTWKLELTDENTLTLKERVLRGRRNGAPLVFHRGK